MFLSLPSSDDDELREWLWKWWYRGGDKKGWCLVCKFQNPFYGFHSSAYNLPYKVKIRIFVAKSISVPKLRILKNWANSNFLSSIKIDKYMERETTWTQYIYDAFFVVGIQWRAVLHNVTTKSMMMTMIEMTKNMMTKMGEMIPVYMSEVTKNMMIPVWDDNEKQICGNALKRQEARVTSCYQ